MTDAMVRFKIKVKKTKVLLGIYDKYRGKNKVIQVL